MTDVVGSSLGNPKHVGIDMTKWDLTSLQSGEITAASGDSVTIDVGHHTYVLTGHDFAFVTSNGHMSLAAGTITGLGYYPELSDGPTVVAPVPLYLLSNFSLDVADFNAFVASNNVVQYQHALLSGDDDLAGGASMDVLRGMGGNDHVDGGGAADTVKGGRGNDVLIGGAGADWLRGGDGANSFVFHGAADSGGGVYDTIERFNSHHDHIVVPSAVTGIDAPVDAGTSTSYNVDPNLAAALDAVHLGARHAVIATVVVDTGPALTSANPAAVLETFLVVDVNGIAGYQAGEDLAIRIALPHDQGLSHLGIDNFISLTG